MNIPFTQPTLIVVTGPTASGKTAAAVKLALHYKTVIVSADSRQFYREMSVGTAKPNSAELAAVPHYYINSNTITEHFSVGDYERQCLHLLDELFKDHNVVILAGGSGLYIKAVTEGFDDLPGSDSEIRERLNNELAEKGINSLQERLKIADPVYYKEVDINNPQRVIRALEVFESTGRQFSYYRTGKSNKRCFNIIKLGLHTDRALLYDRINKRVDIMVEEGLVSEARSLMPYRNVNALNTVGYSELFDYFAGKTDLPAAIDAIKQNTRRFAKRQLTWFRKDTEIIWLDALDPDLTNQMINLISSSAVKQ